jgi:hypothetical protein
VRGGDHARPMTGRAWWVEPAGALQGAVKEDTTAATRRAIGHHPQRRRIRLWAQLNRAEMQVERGAVLADGIGIEAGQAIAAEGDVTHDLHLISHAVLTAAGGNLLAGPLHLEDADPFLFSPLCRCHPPHGTRFPCPRLNHGSFLLPFESVFRVTDSAVETGEGVPDPHLRILAV